MLRFIIVVVIQVFITLACASILFVFMPSNGDYWGVALAQLWTCTALLLGDRLLLSSLKAKRMGVSHDLVQKIDNLRALRRFERRFEVFGSREIADNILVIDSVFRAPVLVIGSDVVKKIRDEDLNELLVAAIEKLEHGRWRFACLSAQILSLFAVPMLLFSLSRKTKILNSVVSAPAIVITHLFWKLGGVREIRGSHLRFVMQSYPSLWGAARPRTNKVLGPFIEYLLNYFLLVPPDKSSSLNDINSAALASRLEKA